MHTYTPNLSDHSQRSADTAMYTARQIANANLDELIGMIRKTNDAQRDCLSAVSTEFNQMREALKEARKNIDELTTTISAQAYEIKKLKAALDDAKEARANPIAGPVRPELMNEAEVNVMSEEDEFDALQAKMIARKQQLREPRTVTEEKEVPLNCATRCTMCGHISKEEKGVRVECNCLAPKILLPTYPRIEQAKTKSGLLLEQPASLQSNQNDDREAKKAAVVSIARSFARANGRLSPEPCALE